MEDSFRFSDLDEKNLSYLYTCLGKTAKDIGNIVGLTESSILLKLKKVGLSSSMRNKEKIEREIEYTGKNKRVRKNLTEEVLKSLYLKGLTDAEIGLIYGMTGEGVAYRRKIYRIKSRTPEDLRVALNSRNGLKDLSKLSKEELRDDYICCRSIKKIATKYNSTFNTVKKYLEKFNIDTDDLLKSHYGLTEIQKRLIVGGLLGDGGVYSGGIRGFYYKESHTVEQLDYLKWKVKLFGSMIEDDLYPYTKISDLGLESYEVSFRTLKCVEIASYRELFYREIDGVPFKIIPETVLYNLDPFTLSIWYFDDGGLLNSGGEPYICTGSPINYVNKASEILNEIFDLGCEVIERGSISIIKIKNIDKFFNIINPYTLPCFFYKVPNKYRFNYSSIRGDLLDLPEKIERFNPEEWLNLSNDDQESWVNDIAKYYSHIGFPYFKIKSPEKFQEELKKLEQKEVRNEVTKTKVFNRVSSVCTELASSYFPHMWAVKVRGKKSVQNNYENSAKFKRVIKNTLKYRKILTDASILSELRHGSTVQNFKPLIAKTLYDLYCPENGVVYDYSSGYGGRLLGACASSTVRKYIGTDPCQQTFFGLRKLSRRLKKFYPQKEVKLFPYCSEDSKWYKDIGPVDVCFSSPPYFDTEKYSEEDTQSYRKYPEFNMWVEKFLYGMIDNCNTVLKEGGYFIINIADVLGHDLQKITFEKLSNVFSFETMYLIKMPSYFSGDKYEPIFVFKKGVERIVTHYDDVMEEYLSLFKYLSSSSLKPKIKRKINKRSKIVFTEDDRKKSCACLKRLNDRGLVLSRNNISNTAHSDFPYPTHIIEREFGSWNGFLRECGLVPEYEVRSSTENVSDYLKFCAENKKVLSFYFFEKQTGKPANRLKRLFNKGKKYSHLKEELALVALKPELWPDFLKKFDV